MSTGESCYANKSLPIKEDIFLSEDHKNGTTSCSDEALNRIRYHRYEMNS